MKSTYDDIILCYMCKYIEIHCTCHIRRVKTCLLQQSFSNPNHSIQSSSLRKMVTVGKRKSSQRVLQVHWEIRGKNIELIIRIINVAECNFFWVCKIQMVVCRHLFRFSVSFFLVRFSIVNIKFSRFFWKFRLLASLAFLFYLF